MWCARDRRHAPTNSPRQRSNTRFARDVRRLPVDPPVPPAITRTLDVLWAFLRKKKLRGACHSITAVAHVLLREQRIDSVPCIGLVLSPHAGYLIHSWLDISGLVYDLAIAFPLAQYEEFSEAPVIAGLHIDTGLHTELLYGFRLNEDDEIPRAGAALPWRRRPPEGRGSWSSPTPSGT